MQKQLTRQMNQQQIDINPNWENDCTTNCLMNEGNTVDGVIAIEKIDYINEERI